MSDNKEVVIDELVKVFTEIDNPTEMKAFLTEILTDTESKNLNMRWRLLERLKKGETQREIASSLHISLCKITRGSKILKQKKSIIKKWL